MTPDGEAVRTKRSERVRSDTTRFEKVEPSAILVKKAKPSPCVQVFDGGTSLPVDLEVLRKEVIQLEESESFWCGSLLRPI